MARIRKADWLKETNLIKLRAWARNGLTNEQIAYNMGCNRSTLQNWMKQEKAIDEAVREGKEVVDIQVENALLKRALGYEYTEEVATPMGEIKEVKRHKEPDVTAAIFWLKNRKPDTWRNKEKADVEAVQANTAYTKAKTKLIEGDEKDTGMLDVLIDIVKSNKEADKK